MRDGFELLLDESALSTRAKKFMRAMIEAAPADAEVRNVYGAQRRVLMLYGPGAPRKLPLIAKHLKLGGRVVMWDLGYWNRETGMRMSVDTLHPTAEQLALAPDGPGRREFTLREDADPNGPILLIGLGAKSVFAYGLNGAHDWEKRKAKELQARYPSRRILWRPKGGKAMELDGLQMSHGNTIEEALKGCSLVACRHSNVAVDACVAGIPVECEDGAAHALYAGSASPTREERAEFLRRLSWWEWSRSEAPAAWDWVTRVTQ